jgi:hypothetical protein
MMGKLQDSPSTAGVDTVQPAVPAPNCCIIADLVRSAAVTDSVRRATSDENQII